MSGKVYVVGIGPGDAGYLTADAVRALDEADVVVGYEIYINLLPEEYKQKRLYYTGMGGEVERCKYAIDEALKGSMVTVVCSGDPVVYGMASLIYKIASDEDKFGDDLSSTNFSSVDITIIPGITAALSGAAVLGAPIGNDFAMISLSTALTPWETIENRLISAAKGDFVIVLYNPMSRHRPDTLRKACDIMSDYMGDDRIAGYVRNIGRAGQEHEITTLGALRDAKLDMFTTVFIGNSSTENINGKMITGRKYEI